MPLPIPDYYNLSQCAVILGLSRDACGRLVKAGKLETVALDGFTRRMVTRESLERYYEAYKQPTPVNHLA